MAKDKMQYPEYIRMKEAQAAKSNPKEPKSQWQKMKENIARRLKADIDKK